MIPVLFLTASLAASEAPPARVVVIEAQHNPFLDHQHKKVARRVKRSLHHPSPTLLPATDAYQRGRDKPGRHKLTELRAQVGDGLIERFEVAAAAAAAIEDDDLDMEGWLDKAAELRALMAEMWFIDREELREPFFQVCVQAGRAAALHGQSYPPSFRQIGGRTVNHSWYIAASLAEQEPALLDSIEDPDLRARLQDEVEALDEGERARLSFRQPGWNAEQFEAEFDLFVNGKQVSTDDQGIYTAPIGRLDVHLVRPDSHSMSDHYDLTRFRMWDVNVWTDARHMMVYDLREQLMADPKVDVPAIDVRILESLAIYQQLHSESEIWVALPVRRRGLQLWRWMPDTATLVRDRG